jgi:transcriptional regulator with XRE-family HTH domain
VTNGVAFIGVKLKKYREALGLSLTDLEAMTGLKPGHLSELENGKTQPRPLTVEKLCTGLKIDEEYFFLEDSRLPVEVLPSMPESVQKMILSGDSVPYLVVAEKAKKQGISPETLEKMLDLLTNK